MNLVKGATACVGTFLVSWFGLAFLFGMFRGLIEVFGGVLPDTLFIPLTIAVIAALIAGAYFAFIEK